VSKVTCEQFSFAKVSHPTTLSIWLSGFYHGKREKLHKFCRQPPNYKVPIMEAAERALGKPR
jgi:hypothetical protein